MKQIPLTQGKFALVDDEDYDSLMKFKWQAKFRNNNWYACHSYAIGKKTTTIPMHRMLLKPEKGKIVDHKDHNGLNNQRYNIRICTYSQNAKNKSSHGSSKYLGVHHDKGKKSWINKDGSKTVKYYPIYKAMIHDGKKSMFLGVFPDTKEGEILAAKCYDNKAKEIHKEFANLNFKDE